MIYQSFCDLNTVRVIFELIGFVVAVVIKQSEHLFSKHTKYILLTGVSVFMFVC